MEYSDAVRASANAAPISRKVVLVVDDMAVIRMFIDEVLDEQGYHVLVAEDGPAAMQVLDSDARIDLLLTDVKLPNGMDGWQIAREAVVHRPELQVLFMTGGYVKRGPDTGNAADDGDVLSKPFTAAMLARRIALAFERDRDVL